MGKEQMIGRITQQSSSVLFFFIIITITVIQCCFGSKEDVGMLYPRDSESRTSNTLTGMWNFRIDDSAQRNRGFTEKWFNQPLVKTGPVIPMPVPSSYNDVTQERAIRDFVGWAWYDTTVFVSSLWQSQRVVLRFDSAHYNTIVWVNGQEVLSHEGGHLPFEAALGDDVIKFGSANRITVAVNNTLTPTTLPPGAIIYQTDTNLYPPGYFTQQYQFDFFNYAGIHRSVKLYTTPRCYIDDITINTNFSQQTGYVKYNVSRGGQCGDTIGWTVEALDAEGTVVASAGEAGGVLTIGSVHLWWPVHMAKQPAYQYTLKVTLKSSDSVDVYRQRFGVRVVSQSNKRIFINGKPFYCQGFGKHEDSDIRGKGLDYPLIAKDFNLIAWVGANCFRTSHYPYAEEIMDMADQQGVMVIDECPGVGIQKKENFGPVSLAHHREVMMELIRRDKNRPSVFMWSVGNEPLSQLPEAEAYFKSVFDYTRSLDGTRLVTLVLGPTDYSNDRAAKYCDVICVNHYYGWYQDTGDISVISRQSTYKLVNWHKKFDRPVIVTEYGADTIAGLHQDPSFVFTEEFQVDFIREYHREFDELRKDFLAGEMIWNFADFMTAQGVTRVVGNRKGIFTRQRQPKMAAHVLRARYWALAGNQTMTFVPHQHKFGNGNEL